MYVCLRISEQYFKNDFFSCTMFMSLSPEFLQTGLLEKNIDTDFLRFLFYLGYNFTDDNKLTGTIPSETGLLTNLIELDFCKFLFLETCRLYIPLKQMHYYEFVLILFHLLISSCFNF